MGRMILVPPRLYSSFKLFQFFKNGGYVLGLNVWHKL